MSVIKLYTTGTLATVYIQDMGNLELIRCGAIEVESSDDILNDLVDFNTNRLCQKK